MKLRVLLVDDHEIMLDGLRFPLLDQEPSFEIVGEVRDGQTALAEAVEKRPDIVVMDISMPGMNGIESTSRIKSAVPEVKIICLSMHTEASFVQAALEAGATGYITKECALDELVRAIRVVAEDQVYLSPRIAASVVRSSKARRVVGHKPGPFTTLTDREREVLQLLSEGVSTKEIAERLEVSPKTIGSHREHLMIKLEIHSVAGLTKYAIRHGLTTVDQ